MDKRGALLTGFSLELVAVGLLLCFLGYLRAVITGAPPIKYRARHVNGRRVDDHHSHCRGRDPARHRDHLARRPAPPDPVLARFAYDIQTLATYAITSTAALVSIGVPSIVIWRTGVLPRWLSVLGAAEIAVNIAELSGLSSQHGALASGSRLRHRAASCGSHGSPPPAPA